MRTAILLACVASIAFGEVHERTVTVHGRQWLVKYDVGTCDAPRFENCTLNVPATMPPGQPHYGAQISVFLTDKSVMPESSCLPITSLIGGPCMATLGTEQIQIGPSIVGQWTQNGCTEDDPQVLVENALGHNHATTISGSGSSFGATGAINQVSSPACQQGEVDFRPLDDSGVVVLTARVCRNGKWQRGQVKIGISAK